MSAIRSKSARHQRIIDMLSHTSVHTQDQLRETLLAAGFSVTQATLSRDLDEIGATKVLGPAGESIYAVPADGDPRRTPAPLPDADAVARMGRVAAEVVTGIDASLNIVVVHTRPGAAHYLAGAIDRNGWPQILGTVAGDDTVLLVTSSASSGDEVKDLLLELVSTKSAKKNTAPAKNGDSNG